MRGGEPRGGGKAAELAGMAPARRDSLERTFLNRVAGSPLVAVTPVGGAYRLRGVRGDLAIFRVRDSMAEVAAYRLSRALGVFFVPPAVPHHRWGTSGSLQHFVEGVEGAALHPGAADPLRPWDAEEVPLSSRVDARAFDYLIGQRDRHGCNWVLAPGGRLVLFDHAGSFFAAPEEALTVQLADVAVVSSALRERLRTLTEWQLLRALGPLRIERELRDIHAVQERLARLRARLGIVAAEETEPAPGFAGL